MGYEQMNQMTMTTTAMMKNFNTMGPISTPQKKKTRRSLSAIDGGAAAAATVAGLGDRRRNLKTLDLSGMSLASLSASSINLASISKLDLSNNNIQVCKFMLDRTHRKDEFSPIVEISNF